MTNALMVFGMFPFALAGGAGSGIKSPMGIAHLYDFKFIACACFYRLIAPLDDKLRKWY
ncbi:hypothetical protein [uncultured Helicobacter sp.]|uniref:hypothetical protein n=1 Tax=uncultured Helicobacter sp. TaxID=175537 RepID=UPI00262013AD|nr:hypothetical protein [uncultured Helicobacter sp.]